MNNRRPKIKQRLKTSELDPVSVVVATEPI